MRFQSFRKSFHPRPFQKKQTPSVTIRHHPSRHSTFGLSRAKTPFPPPRCWCLASLEGDRHPNDAVLARELVARGGSMMRSEGWAKGQRKAQNGLGLKNGEFLSHQDVCTDPFGCCSGALTEVVSCCSESRIETVSWVEQKTTGCILRGCFSFLSRVQVREAWKASFSSWDSSSCSCSSNCRATCSVLTCHPRGRFWPRWFPVGMPGEDEANAPKAVTSELGGWTSLLLSMWKKP